MKTVQIITAKPSNPPFRKCKGCGRLIKLGEKCLRYKKASHSNYHCMECAKRYNPAALEEALNDDDEKITSHP